MNKPLVGDDGKLHLNYYLFDWDDNIVYMPTRIWMEDVNDGTEVSFSTTEFATRRHDPKLKTTETSFREFGDDTGDFGGDLKKAMQGSMWKGPAFKDFKVAVMTGRLFAIITARGHSEDIMREAVSDFIDQILSKDEYDQMLESLKEFKSIAGEVSDIKSVKREYLASCRFIGVQNPSVKEKSGAQSVEEGKRMAIRGFVNYVVDNNNKVFGEKHKGFDMSFGMSDDDQKNIEAVDGLMREELSLLHPNVKFVAFNTGGDKLSRMKSHLGKRDSDCCAGCKRACVVH